LTKETQAIAIESLECGAIDYISKPSQQEMENIDEYANKLIEMVKVAAHANVKSFRAERAHKKKSTDLINIVHSTDLLYEQIISIGASVGGVEALETILTSLPKVFPPIVAVLHIRSDFMNFFIQRMNDLCHMTVQIVKDGMNLLPGNIYFAPGNYHFVIYKSFKGYIGTLDDSPTVQGHKPSIDVLFNSVALAAGPHSIGVLLTGMGNDGAVGLKQIKERGGATIVQDEITSVVWGMPGAAVKLNAVDHIVPLQDMAQTIMSALDIKMQKK
jgi:two-component system chemotaxis response regulator CheB